MLKEWEMKNWNGNTQSFRAELSNFVEVEGSCEYDGSHKVKLLKKIEVKRGDNWEVYPSTYSVSDGPSLYTRCFVTDGESIIKCGSPNGVPDWKLINEAKKLGVHTVDIT